jgi:hypothetical protein
MMNLNKFIEFHKEQEAQDFVSIDSLKKSGDKLEE